MRKKSTRIKENIHVYLHLSRGKECVSMLENIMELVLEILIPLCELMEIFIVAVSAIVAFARYLRGLFTRSQENIKFELANGLALSLEFKMAAEILKTVLVRDLNELVVLGAVIVLRALLSLLIHVEMKHK